jgi:hypothetical protein
MDRKCKCHQDIYFEFTLLYLGCIDTNPASGETCPVLVYGKLDTRTPIW